MKRKPVKCCIEHATNCDDKSITFPLPLPLPPRRRHRRRRPLPPRHRRRRLCH